MTMPYLRELAREIHGSWVLLIALVVALVLFVLSLLFKVPDLVLRFVPPYVVYSAYAITPKVEEGGDLIVSYHVKRKRICKTEVHRFFYALPSDIRVWSEVVPGGSTGTVETMALLVSMQLPAEAVPGHYALRSMLFSECREGMHDFPVPPVYFQVVPRL